jgi:hypothetical protein
MIQQLDAAVKMIRQQFAEPLLFMAWCVRAPSTGPAQG